MLRAPALLLAAAVVVSACGGSDNTSSSNTIGASTGGAEVRVASAAQLPVTVRAAQDSAGAPPLPQGALEPLGAIQQFTPMGLTAPGLSIAVPFNPQLLDSGAQPRLLVAQPGGEWTLVADARVETQGNTSLLVADVPQLGYAVVVQVPAEAAASSADGKAKSAGTSVRITSGQPLVSLQLQSSQPALAPQPEGADLFRVGQPTTLVQSVRVDFNTACAPEVRVYGALAKMVGDQLNTQVFTLASRAFPVGSTSAAFTATHTLDAAHNGSYATFASATCTRTVGGSWANQVLSRVPAVALGQYFDVNVQAPVAVPQITQAPQNASVTEGSTASFSVAATGAAPLAYQWQRSANGSDWTNVANATGSSLSLTATLADNGSLWRVVVSNASGQATSTPAQLSVTQQLIVPSISSQPQNQTVVEGQNASFSVAASGQPAPSIQWQTRMLDSSNTETGWTDIPGATQASYTTPATTQADHQRQFRARISNSAGSLNSAAATLSVSAKVIAPSITQQPVGAEVIEGASADFTVAASGSTPLSYQWFKDGVALVGANGATVSIPTGAADAGKTIAITVRVSNGAGQVTSQAASLVVTAADTGTVSGLINAGEGGSLSTANGVATLDVPAGALSANTTLTLKTVSPAGFTLPEGATPVGEVIVVGPAGTVFSQPVGISIPTPEDIPDGFALAIIELPEPSGARASGQKARAAAAKMRAQAATDNVFSCLQPQATVGGFTYAAIAQAARAAFVQVPSEACSLIGAPLLQTVGAIGKVPSDTTDACGADSDFIRPAGIDAFEGQLVSRHVACGRFQENNLDVDVPAKDAQGAAYIEPKAAKMALDVMWSIHGKPGGGASKKLTLKIKQSIAKVSSNLPAGAALPVVKVLARTDCTAQGGPAVTCASTRNFDLPTNGAATFTLDVPVNWDAGERAWSELVPGLELLYSSDGAAPDTEVSGRTSQVYRGLEVRLRCDLGLAKAGSNGCVLPDATPVLVLRSSDGPEAVQHMREAMDPNGPIKAPGAFKLKPGTRAIADPSVTDKGLQYAKLGKVRDRNRFASCNRPPATGAPGLIVTRPGGKSASCQANEASCQCDEYPFAASWNGGAVDPARTSVKMINGDDNGNVGRKYGNWLVSQRVLDFTTFADGPFTPLDTDIPTYESADTFWIHIQ